MAEGVREGGGDFVMKVCSLSNKWSRRRWLDSDVAVYRLRLIERRVEKCAANTSYAGVLEYTSCARKPTATLIELTCRYLPSAIHLLCDRCY